MQAGSNKSLTPIISEEEFLPVVQKDSRRLFSILRVLDDESLSVNKFYYFTLLQEAEKMEGFLDDHRARTNLRWLYFAEIIACIRNFSMAGFHLYHVLDRYVDYLGSERNSIRKDFEKAAHGTLEYFNSVIRRFHKALIDESVVQGMSVDVELPASDAWHMKIAPQLPFTIAIDNFADEAERIVSVAQGYRHVYKDFKGKSFHRKIKATDLSEVIPSKMNETLMAEMESALHNLQSEYDTHIRGGRTEQENVWMVTLRGLTAIPMHLFELLRWLVHFYERHENEIRKSDVKARISEMVNNDMLLSTMTNFALHYSNRYLAEGNEVAERVLSMYVNPITYELPLPQPQGFHARPATYVSLIVQEHGTDMYMIVDDKKFSCRSVLELLEAGGLMADNGNKTVLFEGDKRALDDLKILAEANYCEDRDIPTELSYLRILRNL